MYRFLLLAVLTFAGLHAQAISESFEGPALNPGWTVQQQAGTVTLSTDQAVSGAQSLKMASISNGLQRTITATRQLPGASKGLFTVYFYDKDPGLESLYIYFNLYNSTDGSKLARIGVDDYDGVCYKADTHTAGVQQGPSQNCAGGFRSDTGTTNVTRTAGWHRFDIDVQAASIVYKIDGNTVYTFSGDLSFDRVTLAVSGPFRRPNTIAYFDDFAFTPPSPSYSVCPLFDQTKAVKSGATIPIKLQLCDSNGGNLSGANIAVHATGLVLVSTSTSAEIQDAGNANPDYDFRYDATLGGTGGYTFNLKTTGLQSGTYRLSFTAGGNPAVYSVQFLVK